jgi:hypothetical protein
MGASAGDLLARDLVAKWIQDADIECTTAAAEPFEGEHWANLDPSEYTHVVFVCGPCGNGPPLTELLSRFAHCKWVGVNLTMLQDLSEWNPFELLVERDSSRTNRPDIAFLTEPLRVPRVGLILVHPQQEYGHLGRHEQVNAQVREWLARQDVAVVPIDTRLDENASGLRTSGQVEAIISAMDFTVTTRLHGTVLSLINGVPPIVIDPIAGGAKVASQCNVIGWPCLCLPDDLDHSWLDSAAAFCSSQAATDNVHRVCRHARRELADVRATVIDYLVADRHAESGGAK